MKLIARSLLVFAAFGLAAGCRHPKPQYGRQLPPGMMALEKITDPSQIPDFGPGLARRDALLTAVDHSLAYYAKPSSRQHFPYLDISHERAVASLARFREVLTAATDPAGFHETLVREFDVYRSIGWDGEGTVFFTGYCAPIYDGSLERTAEFQYPLYKRPADLVTAPDGTPLGRRTESGEVVPYPTRREIERGALLAGQELVWLRDRFEAYIVHIQGSARIRLPDGSLLEIGYAGKTDRAYRSAGWAMVDDGKIAEEDLSLPALKGHFRQHPEDLDRYLHRNESFVFFAPTEGGPFGSLGAPVTPYATIATDKSVFPRGALAYVVTELPQRAYDGRIEMEPYSGFALDQDTGGAIRSAGRCDIYLGVGPEAEELAGMVGREGRLYYLFLKEAALAGHAASRP